MKPLLCLDESQACSSLPVCAFPSTFSSRQSQVFLYTQCPYSHSFGATLPPNPSFQGLQSQPSPLHFKSLTLITLSCCIKVLCCIKHFQHRHFPWYPSRQSNLCLNPLILHLPSVCHIQTIPYSLPSTGPILRASLTGLMEEFTSVILLHDPSSCLTP